MVGDKKEDGSSFVILGVYAQFINVSTVTRLGKFRPIGRLITFFENYKIIVIF
jgi:hypothetical protein